MRILYNSKRTDFKTPFGVLKPAQTCTLHLHIPKTVQTTGVSIVLLAEDGQAFSRVPMQLEQEQGPYEIYCGCFRFDACGLYFYYFDICTKTTFTSRGTTPTCAPEIFGR